MNKNKQNPTSANAEVQEAVAALLGAGVLTASEEEAILLKCFRSLNEVNRLCAISRIEGIAEGQRYAEIQKPA